MSHKEVRTMPRGRKKSSTKSENGLLPEYEFPSIYSEEFFSEVESKPKKKRSSRGKGKKKSM
jgi:hypothetical protein